MRKRSTICSSLLCLLLAGCSHALGGAGATSRPVYFSPTEIAFVRKQIAKCAGKVSRCRLARTQEAQQARLASQRDRARWQAEISACQKKIKALSDRSCPTCLWKVLGAGLVGLAVGAIVGGVLGVTLWRGK